MRNTTVLATRKDFNPFTLALKVRCEAEGEVLVRICLLYTSDAADDMSAV